MLFPQEHTVMVRQTSKWGQIFLLSLVGLGATALATAYIYRLDEVITVQGRLVPQSGGVAIKSPLNGQLADVLVKNGQRVEKDQILLIFDVKDAKLREQTISQKLKLEQKRLKDQLLNNTQQQETTKRYILLTDKILGKLRPLEASGAISELQVLKEANQLETQRDQLKQQETQRETIINESLSRNTDLQGQLNQMRNQLRYEFVRAPISGVVFDLEPDNDRYVAQKAEELVKIVPSGGLRGEVNITNKDIGFVQTGQSVKVRVDSFPYTEYGQISGEVSHIGADALPPTQLIPFYHFPVDLKLESSELKARDDTPIKLQAGMTITTTLKLRDRRLIELLSDIFSNRSDGLKRLRQP